MKTLIRTNVIITVIILMVSGISLARGFSTTTTATAPDISGQIAGDVGETNDVYPARSSASRAGTRSVVTPVPKSLARRTGESEAVYQNRLRDWEAEVRRIIDADTNRPTTVTARKSLPERPVKQPSESDAAYNARLRAWEAQVRQMSDSQTESERLSQLLESMKRSVSQPVARTASMPDNILVIPTEEMKTEDILAINEDMNVMSRILINELNQKGITLPNYGSLSLGGVYGGGGMMSGYGSSYGATTGYGINLGFDTDALSSMYLQGYGLLFLMNVNFPLSAPPEAKEQPQETQETQKGEVDTVWQQTRQQIYQPQVASTTSTNTRGPDVKYDAQKIENLKTSLIKALKHAANIRALKSDESVILRIAGSGQTISILNVAQDGDNSIINYESNGIQQLVKISGDLEDYIKSLSAPTVILIRAKKSDIDSFAKGELDMEQFRQRVQIISYPLLKNTFQSATTGRTSVPFGTAGTRGTTTGTSITTTGRRTSRTSVVPSQPANETDNGR